MLPLVKLSCGAGDKDTEVKESMGIKMGQQKAVRYIGDDLGLPSLAVPSSLQAAMMIILGSKSTQFYLWIKFHEEILLSVCIRWSVIPSPHVWSSEHRQKNQITQAILPQQALPFCFSFLRNTPFLPETDILLTVFAAQPSWPDPFFALLCPFPCTRRLTLGISCQLASHRAWSAEGTSRKCRKKEVRALLPGLTGVWQNLRCFAVAAPMEWGEFLHNSCPQGSGNSISSCCPSGPRSDHGFPVLLVSGDLSPLFAPYAFAQHCKPHLIHTPFVPSGWTQGPAMTMADTPTCPGSLYPWGPEVEPYIFH